MASLVPLILRSSRAAARGQSHRHLQQTLQHRQRSVSSSIISAGSSSRLVVGRPRQAAFLSSSSAPEEAELSPSSTTTDTTESKVIDSEWKGTSTKGAASTVTAAGDPKDEDAAPEMLDEVVHGETMEFQAETRQLLDIVTHSLYSDKEVFLRELVSNASDSLEKLRHLQAANTSGQALLEPDLPLEIRIDVDEVTSTISISDTGIGMTRDEMIANLGTIAKSGSKGFIEEMKRMKSGEVDASLDPARGIIGKFGVGFYSAFMVADKVEFRSQSAKSGDEAPKVWLSDGTGNYEIGDLPEGLRQSRGSRIVLHLKDDHWEFCDESRIESILKRYSNFVNFPIYVNGKRINTIDAVWSKDPKEVEYDEYAEFYKYIANAVDEPLDIYHFRADAPLDVKALFFIPSFHGEKFGMERMEPGVSLYSRKVLIESRSPDILPDWMRFVKGVVDSEDLPLAISREKASDSALISKLRRVLVRKFVANLQKMLKNDRSKYLDEFYKEYAFFLKEGICQDPEFQSQLSKLLFYETSKNKSDDLVSLDEYVARMRPEQKHIYYLVAPTRDAATHSPYLEAFEKADVEVLFLYTAIEDFVLANLEEYEGRKLVSVEKGDIDLSALKSKEDEKDSKDDDKKKDASAGDRELTTAERVEFCEWFRKELGDKRVASCTASTRLESHPAIVTDNESGAMRRMMRFVDTSEGKRDGIPLPRQNVEINPKHPIIVGMYDIIRTEPTLAKVLAEQVFDNCLVAAGLLDDSRSMLPRLNDILVCVVNGAKAQQPASSDTTTSTAEVDSPPVSESAGDASTTSKPDKEAASETVKM